jgi:hypothetical protein
LTHEYGLGLGEILDLGLTLAAAFCQLKVGGLGTEATLDLLSWNLKSWILD